MVARVRVAWSNWPGAPGVSTFYLQDPPVQGDLDAIRTFFNSLVGNLPTGLVIQVPNSGDTIDPGNGHLTGTWSVGTLPGSVNGTGTGAYAGNAGAVVHWLTSAVANNRRVRGRTFLVPLTSGAFDTAGSLSSAFVTTLTTAATTLVGALGNHFLVWNRPKPGGLGFVYAVTGTRVPDLAVSLRSRRI